MFSWFQAFAFKCELHRYTLDTSCNTMVCGNRTGDLFVWRMHTQPPLLLGALSDKGQG